MSFFAVESHQERARVVEVRKRDVEQIIATRDRVVADIVLRARASFESAGPVSTVTGGADIQGAIKGEYGSAEYQQALREIEEYVAREFAGSGSRAVVSCSYSESELITSDWLKGNTSYKETVRSVKAEVAFEPPLS